MRNALLMLIHRQLGLGWRSLVAWYEAQKQRQAKILAGALNRMKNRKLSMAWERWQEWYADVMEQIRLMKGAMGRFMKRQLSMAWERWQFWYEDFMRQKMLLKQAMKRMMHRKLSMGYQRWVEWYQDLLAERYKAGGAIRRMLMRKLSMAWERWQFWYEDVMHQAFIMQGCINRMQNRLFAQAWESWQYAYVGWILENRGKDYMQLRIIWYVDTIGAGLKGAFFGSWRLQAEEWKRDIMAQGLSGTKGNRSRRSSSRDTKQPRAGRGTLMHA